MLNTQNDDNYLQQIGPLFVKNVERNKHKEKENE